MQQYHSRCVKIDEAVSVKAMWSPGFYSVSVLIEVAHIKTDNDSTDHGMFHNSNRHCLGFITSSTIHQSGLGCCHLNCQPPAQPSQARLFPTFSLVKSLGSGTRCDPQPTLQAHAPCFRTGAP